MCILDFMDDDCDIGGLSIYDNYEKENNLMQKWEYDNIFFRDEVKMAEYILKRDKEIKANAEQKRQEKLKAERTKRAKEVVDAYNEYIKTCDEAKKKYEELKEKYMNDYGVRENDYVSFDALFSDINNLFKF